MRHQEYRAVDWCDCVDDLGLIWAVALFRSSIISRHDDNAWVSKNHVLNSALNAAGKGGKTNLLRGITHPQYCVMAGGLTRQTVENFRFAALSFRNRRKIPAMEEGCNSGWVRD